MSCRSRLERGVLLFVASVGDGIGDAAKKIEKHHEEKKQKKTVTSRESAIGRLLTQRRCEQQLIFEQLNKSL